MTEASINLLMQIPLAGIVVFVVVLFLRYLKEEAERTRSFLAEQRTQNNIATARLAEEIKLISQQVVSLNILFAQHNQLAVTRFDELQRTLCNDNPKRKDA